MLCRSGTRESEALSEGFAVGSWVRFVAMGWAWSVGKRVAGTRVFFGCRKSFALLRRVAV